MVTPYYPPVISGVCLYVYYLTRGLLDQGLQVRVHTTNIAPPAGSLTLDLQLAGMDIHRHRSLYELKRSCNPISPSYVVSGIKSSKDFDIVHIHDFPKVCNEALILIMNRLKGNKPLILTPYGAGPPSPTRSLLSRLYWSSGIPRKALRSVDHIIALIPAQAELFAKVCHPDKISIIPAFVLDNYFTNKPLFNEDGKLKILFIGRIVKEKGIKELLYAVQRASSLSRQIELVCIGPDGGYVREALGLISKLGLDSMVKITGALAEEEKLKYLKWCDVLVLPSYYEAFGIPIVEAMAHGKPVIATKTVGAKSLVDHGKTGFLVDVGDSDAIAAYLIEFFREPHLKYEMGEKGLANAREFTLDKMVKRHIEIYKRLI